jgi:hypothetical protein
LEEGGGGHGGSSRVLEMLPLGQDIF